MNFSLIGCVIGVFAAQAAMAADGDRPVLVGRDGPELDACASVGRVTRPDPEKDSYLSVYARPDDNGGEADRVAGGNLVWLCDSDGDWQGIVYPSGPWQDLGDCRVSSPQHAPGPYAGPCRQGWVQARNLELVAG